MKKGEAGREEKRELEWEERNWKRGEKGAGMGGEELEERKR